MQIETVTQEIIETSEIETVDLRSIGAAMIRQMWADVTAGKLNGSKCMSIERERDRSNAIDFFFTGGLEETINQYSLDLRINIIKDKVREMIK